MVASPSLSGLVAFGSAKNRPPQRTASDNCLYKTKRFPLPFELTSDKDDW